MDRRKCIRDIVRLEVAAMLHLASIGKHPLMQDVLERADPESRSVAIDEMRKLEEILRTKVAAEAEA